MDTRYNMIIINDEIKTSDIFSCVYNDYTKRWISNLLRMKRLVKSY